MCENSITLMCLRKFIGSLFHDGWRNLERLQAYNFTGKVNGMVSRCIDGITCENIGIIAINSRGTRNSQSTDDDKDIGSARHSALSETSAPESF